MPGGSKLFLSSDHEEKRRPVYAFPCMKLALSESKSLAKLDYSSPVVWIACELIIRQCGKQAPTFKTNSRTM